MEAPRRTGNAATGPASRGSGSAPLATQLSDQERALELQREQYNMATLQMVGDKEGLAKAIAAKEGQLARECQTKSKREQNQDKDMEAEKRHFDPVEGP